VEIFNIVKNIELRMQLSPLWGLSLLTEVVPDYPNTGSSYLVRVTDAPFGIAGGSSKSLVNAFEGLAQIISLKIGSAAFKPDDQPDSEILIRSQVVEAQNTIIAHDQEYIISDYKPPSKFSYHLTADCETIITWRFQNTSRGTRILYEEIFCDENKGGEDFLPTVHNMIHDWLVNIKRYGELRGSRSCIILKWFLDRYYLKLRPDQRRTVLLVLIIQAIALITFLVAAISLGLVGVIF
jgi:hypothetical protein